MIIVLAIVVIVQSLALLLAAWLIWKQANRLNERGRRARRVPQTTTRPSPLPKEEEFVAEVRRILRM